MREVLRKYLYVSVALALGVGLLGGYFAAHVIGEGRLNNEMNKRIFESCVDYFAEKARAAGESIVPGDILACKQMVRD